MKFLLALTICMVLSGCASLKGVEISEDERKVCEAEGCTVWTRLELEELVRQSIMRGVEAARRQKGTI